MKVQIIGAGFSGLSAAYFLSRAGFQVEIFEREAFAGGLLQTTQTSNGLIESAANASLNSSMLEELCATVGVELIPSSNAARSRFIWRDGSARRWPIRGLEHLYLLRFLLKCLFRRQSIRPLPRETLGEWGERILKSTNLLRYSFAVAFQGVYGAETERLSAKLLLGSLFSAKPKRTSLKYGHGSVAPTAGMGELVEKLKVYLQSRGVHFHFSFDYTRAHREETTPLIIATSIKGAAAMLEQLGDSRAAILSGTAMKPLTSVTIFVRGEPVVEGFGCLFPQGEGLSALGVLINSCIFPGRSASGLQSETWIFGRTFEDDEAVRNEIGQLRQKLGRVAGDILFAQIHQWPEALPDYDRQLEKAVSELNAKAPGANNIWLLGNYLGKIGLRQLLEQSSDVAAKITNLYAEETK